MKFRWEDVYDFKRQRVKSHIYVQEEKTAKTAVVLINQNVASAVLKYKRELPEVSASDYLFPSSCKRHAPISRVQAFRIVKKAANVVENTTAAESQIRDTDMATEMVKYSNNNILSQAGQAMLAQANQSNQGVLSLLQ